MGCGEFFRAKDPEWNSWNAFYEAVKTSLSGNAMNGLEEFQVRAD